MDGKRGDWWSRKMNNDQYIINYCFLPICLKSYGFQNQITCWIKSIQFPSKFTKPQILNNWQNFDVNQNNYPRNVFWFYTRITTDSATELLHYERLWQLRIGHSPTYLPADARQTKAQTCTNSTATDWWSHSLKISTENQNVLSINRSTMSTDDWQWSWPGMFKLVGVWKWICEFIIQTKR